MGTGAIRERVGAGARVVGAALADDAAALGRSAIAAAVTVFATPPPERSWPLRSRGRRGRPRRDRMWLVDVVLTVIVITTTAATYAGAITGVTPSHEPIAAVTAGLPLLVRDRWPIAAWRTALAVALLSAGLFDPWVPEVHLLPLLVTSYTAVVRAERPIALGAGALTVLGLAVLPALAAEGAEVFAPQEWVGVGLALLAPIVLGHNVRARRQSQAALSDEQRLGEVVRAERAVLAERARIARELHDVVAHHMTLIAIQAEAAPLRSAGDAEALRGDLATIRTTALSALSETRRILGVLRDDRAADGVEPPAPGLAQLADLADAAREAGHEVRLDADVTDADVTPGVALSVHRIVQESLSNVLRHAPGAPVEVTVRGADPSAGLEVRVTNGVATGPPRATEGDGPGHGLVGMRERVAMLDGRLEAGPTAGGGYAVHVVLPGSRA